MTERALAGIRQGGVHVALRSAGQALEFVGWVLVARRLGTSSFGAVAIAFALCRYGGLIADWGATISGPRDVARAGGSASAALIRRRRVMGFSLTAVAVAVAVIGGWTELAPMSLVILARGLGRDWLALGREQMTRAGLPAVVQGTGMVVGAIASSSPGAIVVGIGGAYLLGALVSVALNRAQITAGKSAPAESWMLLALLANQLLLDLDVILIGALSSSSDAGIYAAVYRLPNALNSLIALGLMTALPAVTRAVTDDPGAFRSVRKRAIRVSATLGGGAAVALPVPVMVLVPILLGSDYRSGGASAAILMVGVCVAMMAAPLHPLYLAVGSDRLYAQLLAGTAAFNITANLVCIGLFGITGAAVATLASQLLVYAGLLTMTGRATPAPRQRAIR